MGHIFAELELSNPRISELGAIKINALADTGELLVDQKLKDTVDSAI